MKISPFVFFSCLAVSVTLAANAAKSSDFHDWAATPPMGWNSWDNFATTVTEKQAKEQADVMARDLKDHGWQYIIVDIQWYEPGAESHAYREDAVLVMDEYGRLQPAPNRFPSAAGGHGFTELAAYVHGKGLKFGLHLMRGIPRQAVEKNLPVYGTEYRARDIANTDSICPWNPDMYGVDMNKPGAQAYYNSVFSMFADWGVDYVKVDDISRPYHEHQAEIEAIRKAIDNTDRPIVLSLSPGATALSAAKHVQQHANLWRISDDFWDRWLSIREQFTRLAKWNPHRITGAWPDADMLPIGVINMNERHSRFTMDEQYTLMTLWSIARSPLMMGGDLTELDPFTLSLMTNDAVLAVNQHSENNRPLFNRDDLIAWVADVPGSDDQYLALFNASDRVPMRAKDAVFASEWLSRDNESKRVDIDVDITGAEQLFLVAEGLEDDATSDYIIWQNPVLHFADGTSKPLTDFRWTKADALWDTSKIQKDEEGNIVGIGALAPARQSFLLPQDAVRFTAEGTVNSWTNDKLRFIVALDTAETRGPALGLPVAVDLSELGFEGPVRIQNLWSHQDLGEFDERFAPIIPYHGAGLYRLSPANKE